MHSKHNADGQPLVQGLEEVNRRVRLVQAAWTNFSHWQEVGAQCEMTARHLLVARSLLIEAVEEWALALGRLLSLSRQESGMERLTDSLERSLRRAADYLSMAALADNHSLLQVRFVA